MEYIISVILSIVGNLLTPTAKKLLHWPVEPDQPVPLPIPDVGEATLRTDEEKEAIREYNRQRLARVGRLLWIHGITFFILCIAFYLPLKLRMPQNADLAFGDTRLAAFGLDCVFNHQQVGLISVAFALLLYVPIWFLSQPIGHFVATLWDQVSKVSPARYVSLIALSFIALVFVVSGHWIFVLFPKNSYLFSIGLPFVAVAAVGALSGRR